MDVIEVCLPRKTPEGVKQHCGNSVNFSWICTLAKDLAHVSFLGNN